MNYIKYCFLLFLLFVSSCKDDTEINIELQFYLDRFEEEANERGFSYVDQINEMDIHLVEIITSGILGQCVREDEDPNTIHIDRDYWVNEATELQKEFLVFHELGHCVLNRNHLNASSTDGSCISIMYDGNSSQCILDYSEISKEEMIDELFQ